MIQVKLWKGSSLLEGSERIDNVENETLRLKTQLLGSSIKKEGGCSNQALLNGESLSWGPHARLELNSGNRRSTV